jgi:methionyl aminopeptidase
MIITNKDDERSLKEGGKKLASILRELTGMVKPGITTIEIDQAAEKKIRDVGGEPSFKNYRARGSDNGFPASVCISINEEVVHGIPAAHAIKDGDLVSLDIGMKYKDIFTDTAVTIGVGSIDVKAKKLISVTNRALQVGISKAKVGGATGDIGHAVQKYVEAEGFGVVKELVGHGVGRAVHEEPDVPNWGKPNEGVELPDGIVLALEPMVTMGSPKVEVSKDGWTWKTKDGKLSAHFEHTILITKKGVTIVTA